MTAYVGKYSEDAMEESDALDYNESQTWILALSKLDKSFTRAPAGYYNGVMSQNSQGEGYVVYPNGQVDEANATNLRVLAKRLKVPAPARVEDDEQDRLNMIDALWGYATIG